MYTYNKTLSPVFNQAKESRQKKVLKSCVILDKKKILEEYTR